MKSSGSTMPADGASAPAPRRRCSASSSSETVGRYRGTKLVAVQAVLEHLQIDHLLQCVTAAAGQRRGSRGEGLGQRARARRASSAGAPAPLLGMAHHEPLRAPGCRRACSGGSPGRAHARSATSAPRSATTAVGLAPARPGQHRRAGRQPAMIARPEGPRRMAEELDRDAVGRPRRWSNGTTTASPADSAASSASSESRLEKTPKPASLKRRVTRRSSHSGLIGRRTKWKSPRSSGKRAMPAVVDLPVAEVAGQDEHAPLPWSRAAMKFSMPPRRAPALSWPRCSSSGSAGTSVTKRHRWP